MKFARLGVKGQEKPAVMVSESEAVFVDHLISDWNRSELEGGAIAKVAAADLSSLPRVKVSDYRIGSPLARPTNIICVGLNYAKHAAESGMTPPPEPVVFTKARTLQLARTMTSSFPLTASKPIMKLKSRL